MVFLTGDTWPHKNKNSHKARPSVTHGLLHVTGGMRVCVRYTYIGYSQKLGNQ